MGGDGISDKSAVRTGGINSYFSERHILSKTSENHEIYRKLIEKVSFIAYLPFPAGWDGTVVESVPVLFLPFEIRFSGWERKQPGDRYCVRTVE